MSHVEDTTPHAAPMTAQKAPATAHSDAATAQTEPVIVPIASTKSYTEAATVHTHAFEPAATAHEKWRSYFLKGCLLSVIYINFQKIFRSEFGISPRCLGDR